MTDIICRIQGSTHFPPSGGVIDIGRGPCPVCGKGAVALTDQTPEARMAAALHAIACTENTCPGMDRSDLHRSFYEDRANDLTAADPTIAADLALAAAVRESGLVDAAKALDRFMRQPDENEDGTPADWAPGLDAIGDFQNAVAIIQAAKEAERE